MGKHGPESGEGPPQKGVGRGCSFLLSLGPAVAGSPDFHLDRSIFLLSLRQDFNL